MEWKEAIAGYTVQFNYREPIGYCFKIYRNGQVLYDSDGLEDTCDREWLRKAARRVIRDQLPAVSH